jgi:hypothetical protein
MMPIPKRKQNEDKDKFVSRCMGNETMKKDYPDQQQRVAICIGQATADCDCVEAADFELQMEAGYAEEINEDNFYIPSEAEYEDFGEETEEWDIAGEKPGLWDNIRKKKEREGKNYKPAKPGDPDRPSKDAWKKAQSDGGDEMALEQIQKMHDQLMEIVMRLKGMSLSVEFQDWTKDMISKAEIYIQNVYDFVKYYEPGKYEDEYTEDEDEVEEPSELETEDPEAYARFKYEDPKTGEVYTYKRQGLYEKDGRRLTFVGEASEYQGRKVTLNKPFRTSNGPKKFAVYVKNESGNVVIVRFGDPNMKIKKNIPERRKSFRARHNCDNPGPKWKARYWSCKAW